MGCVCFILITIMHSFNILRFLAGTERFFLNKNSTVFEIVVHIHGGFISCQHGYTFRS